MLEVVALAVAAGLIIIDQIIKFIVLKGLMPIGSIGLIPNILHLTYVENKGAAFGIFAGKSWLLIGLTSIFLIILLSLVVFRKLAHSKLLLFSVALIIAGGIGNLIDRVLRGFVIDYIDVRLINFAVFNFADCCVVIGTCLLIFCLLFLPQNKKEAHNE